MKALLQIVFVRQCVLLVGSGCTCALAFARYHADLSLALSLPLSLVELPFNGRLALEKNQNQTKPRRSTANQKPNLSHDCRQSVFVSYIDYVSLLLCYCFCCLLLPAAFRLFYVDAPHIYAVLQSPHQTYPILIKLSIKYLPLHLLAFFFWVFCFPLARTVSV